MTNADRIRAMSDEELADEFMRFFTEVLNTNTDGYWSFSDDFRDDLLIDLRQPVKDGDNE
jgi:SAM-dependent MidA family methyltransferase